ncbi:hypothetical protein GCM10011362_02120 [Marinobacter halophilus]|nr:hypothetical protein GCM10011362_02120 [Marinobacter halophilus]
MYGRSLESGVGLRFDLSQGYVDGECLSIPAAVGDEKCHSWTPWGDKSVI